VKPLWTICTSDRGRFFVGFFFASPLPKQIQFLIILNNDYKVIFKHLPLAGFLSPFLLAMFGLGKQVGSAPELFPVKNNHFLNCMFF
jgi:hypothetical protein